MNALFVYHNDQEHTSYGAGYVASALLQAGHTVRFLDTNYDSLESVLTEITAGGYDAVLLSASTLFYPEAVSLSNEIKKISGTPILLGGSHATAAPVNALRDAPGVDFVCVGEGETLAREFFAEPDRRRGLEGIAYRDGPAVIVNPPGPATDLATLPRFRYELFKPESVCQPSPMPGMCYVRATRGCPYSCYHCGNGVMRSLYANYLRRRPVESVLENLLGLMERYPVETWYFSDEMMLYDKDYVRTLLTSVKRETGLPYGCMARVEHVDGDLVEIFRETGCVYVGLGVECGDESFRREFLNRRMTNEQILGAFSLLRGVPGIRLNSFNMRGFPVPYDDRLWRETKRLNESLKPDHVKVATFIPFPGTRLYDFCLRHGLIDWTEYRKRRNTHTKSVLRWDKIRSLEPDIRLRSEE